MRKAAAYYRVSTDKQECSIAVQKEAVDTYAAENGFKIVSTYEDEGRSGTSAEGRPGFLRMVRDAVSSGRAFDYILVYDVSRFSRGDNDEAGHYRYVLRSNGVEVVYITEDFSEDDEDDIKLQFNQWSAAKQPKEASRKTLGTLKERAKNGEPNGGKPPYGFDSQYFHRDGTESIRVRYVPAGRRKWTREIYDSDGRLMMKLGKGEPLPLQEGDTYVHVLGNVFHVNVVQRIFLMYVREGKGLLRIADKLNGEGIPAPGGGVWLKGSVRAILENLEYRGDYEWNRASYSRFYRLQGGKATKRRRRDFKKRFRNRLEDRYRKEGHHEAIVEPGVFDEAQRILQERRAKHMVAPYRSGRAKNSPYLLSGLIKCMRCNRGFQGYTQTKGKRRKDGEKVKTAYYACNGYVNGSKEICPRVLFRKEALEDGVLGFVGHRVGALLRNGGLQRMRKLIAKEIGSAVPNPDIEPKAARSELAETDRRIDGLTDSLAVADEVSRKPILEKISRLGQRKNELEALVREFQSASHEEVDIDATVDKIMASVRGFEDLFPYGALEEQKEFIRLWVDKIELDPDRRVGRVYMKMFPLPSNGNGKSSFEMVAGARFEHQKRNFPPIDVIDIQFEYQGKALVPVGV